MKKNIFKSPKNIALNILILKGIFLALPNKMHAFKSAKNVDFVSQKVTLLVLL